jgi:hypothetical protein
MNDLPTDAIACDDAEGRLRISRALLTALHYPFIDFEGNLIDNLPTGAYTV